MPANNSTKAPATAARRRRHTRPQHAAANPLIAMLDRRVTASTMPMNQTGLEDFAENDDQCGNTMSSLLHDQRAAGGLFLVISVEEIRSGRASVRADVASLEMHHRSTCSVLLSNSIAWRRRFFSLITIGVLAGALISLGRISCLVAQTGFRLRLRIAGPATATETRAMAASGICFESRCEGTWRFFQNRASDIKRCLTLSAAVP